jgi:hypothetical protein
MRERALFAKASLVPVPMPLFMLVSFLPGPNHLDNHRKNPILSLNRKKDGVKGLPRQKEQMNV